MTNGNVPKNNGIKISAEEHKAEISLELAWNNFAESLKKKNKMNLSSTLKSRKPLMEDASIISFSVVNQVQEDEIDAIKIDLLTFLRSAMKNSALQLKIIVDKHDTERKPYTGEEKFQRLAEKNPTLNKLRQQFGLEIDF